MYRAAIDRKNARPQPDAFQSLTRGTDVRRREPEPGTAGTPGRAVARGGQGTLKGTGRDPGTRARWQWQAGDSRDSAQRGRRTLRLRSARGRAQGGVALPPHFRESSLPLAQTAGLARGGRGGGLRGSGFWGQGSLYGLQSPCCVITVPFQEKWIKEHR